MKLDKIKFARLIAFLQVKSKFLLEIDDINQLDDLIDINVEPVSTGKASEADVNELLRQIGNEDGFIPAIEAYRSLTGAGLKEANEAIVRYRVLAKN